MRFSIVVPTRNRPDQLAALLASLAVLDYPADQYEVILVDDGSESPVEATLQPPMGLSTRLLRCEHSGPARARQLGIALARGQYLAFTDDDCAPAADWLRVLERALEEHPGCAVGGRTVNALVESSFSEASQRVITALYASFASHEERFAFFTTNNVGLPAAALREVGGLDVTWSNSGGEDRDLFARWQAHGYGMHYEPRMVVRHAHRLSWRRFAAQHFAYGRGAHQFQVRHAGGRGRALVAPRSFYARLAMAAFAPPRPQRPLAVAALLLVSQLCHTVGFLSEAARPLRRSRRPRIVGSRATWRRTGYLESKPLPLGPAVRAESPREEEPCSR